MISSSGAVRCFDTISLSQKLSLHRLAVRPIQLHLLAWEKPSGPAERIMCSPKLPPASTLLPQLHQNLVETIEGRVDVEEDYVGDLSFRLDDISFECSWVWFQVSVFSYRHLMCICMFWSCLVLYGSDAQFCAAEMQMLAWKCLEYFLVSSQIRDEAFITSEKNIL